MLITIPRTQDGILKLVLVSFLCVISCFNTKVFKFKAVVLAVWDDLIFSSVQFRNAGLHVWLYCHLF